MYLRVRTPPVDRRTSALLSAPPLRAARRAGLASARRLHWTGGALTDVCFGAGGAVRGMSAKPPAVEDDEPAFLVGGGGVRRRGAHVHLRSRQGHQRPHTCEAGAGEASPRLVDAAPRTPNPPVLLLRRSWLLLAVSLRAWRLQATTPARSRWLATVLPQARNAQWARARAGRGHGTHAKLGAVQAPCVRVARRRKHVQCRIAAGSDSHTVRNGLWWFAEDNSHGSAPTVAES